MAELAIRIQRGLVGRLLFVERGDHLEAEMTIIFFLNSHLSVIVVETGAIGAELHVLHVRLEVVGCVERRSARLDDRLLQNRRFLRVSRRFLAGFRRLLRLGLCNFSRFY